MIALIHRLARDASGATIVEFAMIAPVLLTLIMGMFDMGYNIYAQTMLQGSIQQAARDSTIEGSGPRAAALDRIVTEAVHGIVPDATLRFSRTAYSSFSEVGQAEDFTDGNDDGVCNEGEPFEDANSNGAWDADRGVAGQGGARDAVLYTVTATYPRAFPIAQFIGMSPTFSTRASTVLRNQPFDLQNIAPQVGNCE